MKFFSESSDTYFQLQKKKIFWVKDINTISASTWKPTCSTTVTVYNLSLTDGH